MPASSSIRAVKTFVLLGALASVPVLCAQAGTASQAVEGDPSAAPSGGLIAIVPLDPNNPGAAAYVNGGLQIDNGRAFVSTNATIASGNKTTHVTMPYRGTMLVCASTTVKLAADTSVQAGDVPGVLMAMDAGAVEMSFATTHKADVLLTPDFRILIGGAGASEIKVRLGAGGDTCVDNPGADGSFVEVESLFDTSHYRVDPGQRVMFQHGSMQAVVDKEKEPCGCPPDSAVLTGNEFPLAQSEGLAPIPKPASAPMLPQGGAAQTAPPLVYPASAGSAQTAKIPAPASAPPTVTVVTPPAPAPQTKSKGVFGQLGHLIKRIFGAE
jgi:hypothetical protein